MISNRASRIVEFNWYWYRPLNFWHSDIPSHPIIFFPAAPLHWILGFPHLPNPTLTCGYEHVSRLMLVLAKHCCTSQSCWHGCRLLSCSLNTESFIFPPTLKQKKCASREILNRKRKSDRAKTSKQLTHNYKVSSLLQIKNTSVLK